MECNYHVGRRNCRWKQNVTIYAGEIACDGGVRVCFLRIFLHKSNKFIDRYQKDGNIDEDTITYCEMV